MRLSQSTRIVLFDQLVHGVTVQVAIGQSVSELLQLTQDDATGRSVRQQAIDLAWNICEIYRWIIDDGGDDTIGAGLLVATVVTGALKHLVLDGLAESQGDQGEDGEKSQHSVH